MSGAAWKPVLLDAPLDEETMKRYKLIVEHLADSKFRQCMLARNVMSGGGQVTSQVSSYHKGEDLIEFMVASTDVESGLNEIETEEAAIALLDKILAAHVCKAPTAAQPDALRVYAPQLMVRVKALREEVTKEQRISAIAKAKKADPDLDPKSVQMPKGKVQRRDGMPVLFPAAEDATRVEDLSMHPVRMSEGASYVLLHRKDMSSTAYWYFGVIAAIAAAWMTFRFWPAFLQLWVWYLSVTVLIVILGFHAIQFVIFLLCYTVGFDLWIFPKMFDERYHVSEWFTDVIDVQWNGGSWILRVGVALIFVAVAVWALLLSPSEVEVMGEHSVQFVEELYSGKLLEGAAPSQFGIGGKRIPTFEELQRLADEEANAEAAPDATTSAEPAQGGDAGEDAAAPTAAAEDEEEEEEEEEEGGEAELRQMIEEALLAELSNTKEGAEEDEGGEE